MTPIDPGQLKESGFFLLKLGTIVLLSLYFIYSFIIVRQVNLMVNTIDLALKKSLKFVAYIHLIFALLLLLYAIIM